MNQQQNLFGKLKAMVEAAKALAEEPAPAVAVPPVARAAAPATRAKSTLNLGPRAARPTAPLKPEVEAPVAQPAPKASEAELSPRRLAIITDHVNKLVKFPEMNDPKFMYRVVSDERAYQVKRLARLTENQAMAKIGFEQPMANLENEIAATTRLIDQLVTVQKRLTASATAASKAA